MLRSFRSIFEAQFIDDLKKIHIKARTRDETNKLKILAVVLFIVGLIHASSRRSLQTLQLQYLNLHFLSDYLLLESLSENLSANLSANLLMAVLVKIEVLNLHFVLLFLPVF